MQQQLQEKLANLTCEASAGGGMVTVKVNGKQQIVAITIEKEVVNPAEIGMLQDLIAAATNTAIEQSRQLTQEEMKKLMGGLPIPPGILG